MLSTLYTSIALIAFGCYLFLIVALHSAGRNKALRWFRLLLFLFMLWTGGSLFMRLCLWPSYQFWYYLSVVGLFFIPFFFFLFVQIAFHTSITKKQLLLLFACNAVFVIVYAFLVSPPKILPVLSSKMRFSYVLHPLMLLFLLYSMALLLFTSFTIWKKADSPAAARQMILFTWTSALALAVGNLLTVCVDSAFPWDTLSAIVSALCIMLFLPKSGFVTFMLLIRRRVLLLVSTFCGVFLSSCVLYYCADYIYNFTFSSGTKNPLFISSVIGIFFTVAIYIFLEFLTDALYVKEDQLRAQKLREFSLKVNRNQTLPQIVKEMQDLIVQCLSIRRTYAFTRQESTLMFVPTEPLQEALSINANDALCVYLQTVNRSITVKQLMKSGTFANLTDVQKQYILGRKIACIMPLVMENTLFGVLFLTQRNTPFRAIHLNFLDSAAQIAAITFDNVQLYRKMYIEARTDSLTLLCNRYYFLELLEKAFAQCPVGKTVAVAMLAIDDFKLYNQLYGTECGDAVLRYTANYLKNTAKEKNGIAVRFSGKKFALLFPHATCQEAMDVAHKAAVHLGNISAATAASPALHAITFSGGICTYPTVAGSVQSMLDTLDNAVKQARQRGKNNIVVFASREDAAHQPDPTDAYNAYAPTIYALTATIDAKDHYTFNHSQNVAYYACALAKAFGLSEKEVKMINDAAILHDIGKISIPEHILSKPSALTKEEMVIMQRHVENSIAIIRHLPSLDYMVPAAISHHERWDGKGYPRGVAGEDIPLAGRCLAVADAFDAMISRRPYKQPFPLESTLEELRSQAGKQFDPALAVLFADLVENGTVQVRYPAD